MRQGSSLSAVVRRAFAARAASSRADGSGAALIGVSLRALIASAAALIALALPAVASATPTVTIDPVSSHSITTAHVSGTASSGNKGSGRWWFETSTNGVTWIRASEEGELIVNHPDPVPVESTLRGLTAGVSTYQVRLAGSNFNDETTAVSAPVSFETDPAPTTSSLKLGAAENPSFTSIHLAGSFNPEGGNEDPVAGPIPLTAQLEVDREGEGWNPVGGSVTIEGAEALSSTDFPIEAEPTDLRAAAHYEYRLTVTYAGISKSTPPGTFSTLFLPKPTISNLAVTDLTDTSAHFSGEVDPNGTEPVSDTSWHFECTPSCGGLNGGTVLAGASGDELKVANDAELDPNTKYTVTLVASNAAGPVEESKTFTTTAVEPLVKAWAAGPVGPTSADLNAQIAPRGSDTVYWFEWGTEDCSANPCTALPATKDASAGKGQLYVYVLRHLSGLEPETTYHFRVVAKNDSGTVPGDDQQFTTAAPEAACTNEGIRAEQHSGYLPDCRAYEVVSPTDSGSGEVAPVSYQTYAATDGDAITFTSLTGSGDAQGTGGPSSVFITRRTAQPGTNGWATHSIVPPQEAGTIQLVLNALPKFDTFSSDLSRGVFRSITPIGGPTPNSENTPKFYLLDGLRTGLGKSTLLSDSPAPLPPYLPPLSQAAASKPDFAGASADLSHVIFVSRVNLTQPGSPYASFGAGQLYESVEGNIRLVGRIPVEPATSCHDTGGPSVECNDAPSSDAGISASAQYSAGMISADGSRIVFTSGSKIYLREDGTKTFQINASEKDQEPPEFPASAEAWAMSTDGSRIFFTTNEGLVDGDKGGNDLYMYEVEKPAGHRLTRLVAGLKGGSAEVGAVLGASDDGHYVYFSTAVDTRLVAGEPGSQSGIYLWHDGEISYVGAPSLDVVMNLINTPRTSWTYATSAKTSRITPDGRHLLFMAASDSGLKGRGGFASFDHAKCKGSYAIQGQCRELYLYDADSGRLSCPSCNLGGEPSAEHPDNALVNVHAGELPMPSGPHLSQALSDDGRRVFFSTAESLLAEDTNGASDAYEYDMRSGQLYLLSSGTDPSGSYFLDASPDGKDAFIATRERLVGWDADQEYDLYDVRVGGGLPEPAARPAPCNGTESCRAALVPAPPAGNPASATVGGAGNPPQHCPKGRKAVKKAGKSSCVKPKKLRKHKAARNQKGGK